MTDDLFAYLRSEYDAEEHVGQAAAEPFMLGDRTGMKGLHPQILAHVYRHTPADVFADLAAKRAILDLHSTIWRDVGWLDADRDEQMAELPVCDHCVPRHSWFDSRALVPTGPCPTVRLLGSAYAQRPDYRAEWKP